MGLKKVDKKKTYELIVEEIKTLIRNEELNSGQRLPTIKKLAENYNVGQASIRETLVALEVEGIIRKRNCRVYEIV